VPFCYADPNTYDMALRTFDRRAAYTVPPSTLRTYRELLAMLNIFCIPSPFRLTPPFLTRPATLRRRMPANINCRASRGCHSRLALPVSYLSSFMPGCSTTCLTRSGCFFPIQQAHVGCGFAGRYWRRLQPTVFRHLFALLPTFLTLYSHFRRLRGIPASAFHSA